MVQQLKQEIDSLSETIQLEREVAGAHALEKSREITDAIAEEHEKIQRPNSLRRHVIHYLNEQKEAFDAGERDELLCTCTRPYCPSKRGTLAPTVRMADSFSDGIDRYEDEHRGRPVVLLEGRDDFLATARHVKSELQRALVVLRRDERPDADEAEAT